MEKSEKQELHVSGSSVKQSRNTLIILSVAILVLSVTCLLVFTLLATIRFSDVAMANKQSAAVPPAAAAGSPCPACDASGDVTGDDGDKKDTMLCSPREFYVQVPRNEFGNVIPVHQYVSVDEQRQTEAILFKDPENKHMQDMVYVDHKQGFQIMYSSETAECLFVPNIARTMEENLRYLWKHDNRNVSKPAIQHDYTYGDVIDSMEQIPPMMRAFCSMSNSQWLINTDNHIWDASMRYHVCVCSYFECFCTRCESALCWGRCCDAEAVA